MAARQQTAMSRPETLAEKVQYLFATVRPGDGRRPYPLRAVADWITAHDVKVNHATLVLIRDGVTLNPRHDVIVQLAAFFGVPVDFFTPNNPEGVERVMATLEKGEKVSISLEHLDIAALAVPDAGRDSQAVAALDVARLTPQQREAMRQWQAYLAADPHRHLDTPPSS